MSVAGDDGEAEFRSRIHARAGQGAVTSQFRLHEMRPRQRLVRFDVVSAALERACAVQRGVVGQEGQDFLHV